MLAKKDWLRCFCCTLGILVLFAGMTSCNLPQVPGERPPDESMPGDEHPPQEPNPDERPPEPDSGTGSILGTNPAGIGMFMPLSLGACPSDERIAEALVEPDGSFHFDNLVPGKYCVAGSATVTVKAGQEAEVSLP